MFTVSFADEIVLNKILDEDKTILPFKFNYQEIWFFKKGVEYEEFDMEEYREAAKNPVIVHFIGPKPYFCTDRQTYKSEWWRYAKMTEVYQFYLEKNFYNTKIMYEKLSKKLGHPKYPSLKNRLDKQQKKLLNQKKTFK